MFLLDSRALLWILDPSTAAFSSTAQQILKTSDELFVSIASLWKLTEKISEGKLTVPFSPSEFTRICAARSITVLSIAPAELDIVKSLPLLESDSFERMLVATALSHDFTIVTANPAISQFKVATIS